MLQTKIRYQDLESNKCNKRPIDYSSSIMQSETLKCVVVGDGSVGKTCLLIRYAKDDFPTAYIPTVFDSYAVTIPIGDEDYELHLFDTAGQEDYDQLRKLAFDNTDVLLVCFAVDYWPSFINVREMWVPELQKYCPDVPFLLVGTRIDLRDDPRIIEKLAVQGKSPITKQQGEKLAKELRAVKYVECSALTKENVNDVFQEAILTGLSINNPPSPVAVINSDSSVAFNSDRNKSNNAPAPEQDDDVCCFCQPCYTCCNGQSCTIL